jgi:hypothetical protein
MRSTNSRSAEDLVKTTEEAGEAEKGHQDPTEVV